MFFTTTCVGCGSTGGGRGASSRAARWCPSCREGLRPPEPASGHTALVAYDAVGRVPVVALKYRSGRSLVPVLADAMASRVLAEGWQGIDAVTWAPTSRRHRRRRGYDQAELLARAVGRRLGVRARRLLVRVGDDAQTGRGRAERLVGPTFVAIGRVPPRVLVIDDVVTTGATFAAARTALLVGGAHQVRCLAAAATPAESARNHNERPVPLEEGVAYPPVTGGQLVTGGAGRRPGVVRHDN